MGRYNTASGRNTTEISNFVCLECGFTTPLPRIRGQAREKNHIKDIYCVHCKKETKHREVREFDFVEDPDIIIK